jgi:hypothetical protein
MRPSWKKASAPSTAAAPWTMSSAEKSNRAISVYLWQLSNRMRALAHLPVMPAKPGL